MKYLVFLIVIPVYFSRGEGRGGGGGGGFIRNFAVMQYVGLSGGVVFVFYNFPLAFAFQICTLVYSCEEAFSELL